MSPIGTTDEERLSSFILDLLNRGISVDGMLAMIDVLDVEKPAWVDPLRAKGSKVVSLSAWRRARREVR